MGEIMRIRWTSDLATGIRTIDLQHEELIGILNELDTAHANGSELHVLEDVLQRLKAYTVFHFGTEEALMGNLPNGGAHSAEHCQQHRDFIEEISRMRIQSLENPTGTMKSLLDYLNNWLYAHILKSDRILAALLSEQKL